MTTPSCEPVLTDTLVLTEVAYRLVLKEIISANAEGVDDLLGAGKKFLDWKRENLTNTRCQERTVALAALTEIRY